jgi:hypothetical protein
VSEELFDGLAEYSRISIAFQVDRVLQVELVQGGLGGLLLSERPVERPYVKDYDALPGNHPTQLPSQFDLSRWGLLVARINGQRVGGLSWRSIPKGCTCSRVAETWRSCGICGSRPRPAVRAWAARCL